MFYLRKGHLLIFEKLKIIQPPYNFHPYRRFLEASRGGGPNTPPSISKFKNFFIFFSEYENIRKMGPNGVLRYIWYLDLFGVVYFLEVLEPP